MFMVFASNTVLGNKYDEVLDIGLFWDNRPDVAVVSVSNGGYDVYADGQKSTIYLIMML